MIFIPGVKGMKWGQRRYQNKDGTWTELGKERRRLSSGTELVIPHKTKLYRISERGNDLKEGQYLFGEQDFNEYVGSFGYAMAALDGKDVVLRELEIHGDIRVPNYNKSVNIMKTALDQYGIRKSKEDCKHLDEMLKDAGFPDGDSIDKAFYNGHKEFQKYLKTGKMGKNLYDCLNILLCERDDKVMKKIGDIFYKENKKQGYGAITDLNDSKYGGYMSKMPLILTNIDNVKNVKIKDLNYPELNQKQKDDLNNPELEKEMMAWITEQAMK